MYILSNLLYSIGYKQPQVPVIPKWRDHIKHEHQEAGIMGITLECYPPQLEKYKMYVSSGVG